MLLLFVILLHVTQHALGVEVIEGAESVVLPCGAPPGSASSVTWSRYDLIPSIIHVHKRTSQAEEDDLTNQNQLFTNRTEMQPDALRTGHVSLTLKHIQLYDGGTYSCGARGGGRLNQTHVQLKVISKEEAELREQVTQHALGVEVIEGAESVVLPCGAPPGSASSVTWSRYDLIPSNVHVHKKTSQLVEKDDLVNQNQLFTNRTEMQPDALRTGHVSLTLKHIQLYDGGTYICTARGGGRLNQTHVQLKVISKKEAELREQAIQHRNMLTGALIFNFLLVAVLLGLGVYRKGLSVLTAAGAAVLLCGLMVSAASSLSVLRLCCHLVVFCPYCVSTGLMLSICCGRKTGNRAAVSTEMTRRVGGSDDIAADVTAEHAF
ncbi:uncharacterized protein LOC119912416 isoform X3 [Micropterus salmoides]|uniref:uncharacterized protein LOC119912416 isoform X3 n=1 Tax=Micropterus salmoides TaxID=27706 RepID=UPI0018ED7182|nr:uncharacterized protein LOC119912416 isoform X3 [Micropterus salmoides]